MFALLKQLIPSASLRAVRFEDDISPSHSQAVRWITHLTTTNLEMTVSIVRDLHRVGRTSGSERSLSSRSLSGGGCAVRALWLASHRAQQRKDNASWHSTLAPNSGSPLIFPLLLRVACIKQSAAQQWGGFWASRTRACRARATVCENAVAAVSSCSHQLRRPWKYRRTSIAAAWRRFGRTWRTTW